MTVILGNPSHITTSHVERHNQTMRTHMRRYTRRGTTFSKKIQNHCHALALFVAQRWPNGPVCPHCGVPNVFDRFLRDVITVRA